jgi:protease I
MAAKKVAIMVDQMYQVLEVWYPYYRFREAGLEVNLVAAEAKKEYHSKEGYPCLSEVSAKEANAGDYDCMVVPGGFAPDFMRRNVNVIQFANVYSGYLSRRMAVVQHHGLQGQKGNLFYGD